MPFPLISFSLFLTLEGLKLWPARMERCRGAGKQAHTGPFPSTVGVRKSFKLDGRRKSYNSDTGMGVLVSKSRLLCRKCLEEC